ncbi:hypothetical protein [Bacillus alkalisoli]|uniref:hypothetical protein n=1 Tax=Bacillus alkalisoli TaxID=2011008 RepID=UPI000C246414|nr:hypothetical protein [Bacillus alkalisoli]
MDIETAANLFFLCLVLIGVISFFVGVFFMKKSKNHRIGFLTTITISFLLLIFLFNWYQSVAVNLYVGTIPFLFNQAFSIVMYLIYLIITGFLFKSLNKQNIIIQPS